MPILYNNRPLYRIKFKDADIREVRRGNELEWGLYKITYITKLPEKYECKDNITEYVWGYPCYGSDYYNYKDNFELILPEGNDNTYGGFSADVAQTIFGAYQRTYAIEWCSDKECLSYIPAITKDFHRDLLLFCKWIQRQYRYKGTLKNDRYEWGGGGQGGKYPSAPAIGTGPDSLDGNYYNMSSPKDVKGQCTWYAHGRTAEMRGNRGAAAPQGNGDYEGGYSNAYYWGGDWPVGPYGNYGGHWRLESNWDNVEVGDCVVFGTESPGHVAVIEWKSGNDATLSAFNNPSAGYDAVSLGLLPWTAYGNFIGPSYTWGDTSGKFRSFLVNHTDPILTDEGGEEGWRYLETQVFDISDNGDFIVCDPNQVARGSISNGWDSGTQNFPKLPARYNQAGEDSEPGDHWRKDQRYEPAYLATYKRDVTYKQNDDGSYSFVFSNWVLEGSVAELSGTYLSDYDSSESGPLPGWEFNQPEIN